MSASVTSLGTPSVSPSNQLTSLESAVTFIVNGMAIAYWTGNDQNGAPAPNGCYAWHWRYTNNAGVFQQGFLPLVVNRPLSRTLIAVFDASNNEIRRLVYWVADPAPANTFADMSLSTASFQGSYCGAGNPGAVTVTSSNGFTLYWDGRTDAGSLAPTGTYTIRLCNSNDTTVNNYSGTVQMTNLGEPSAAGSLMASPNPAAVGTAVQIQAINCGTSALTLNLQLYNSGNTLVETVAGSAASNVALLSTAGLPAGNYTVQVAVYDNEGYTGTQTLNLTLN